VVLDFWSLLGHLRGAAVEVRAEEEGKVWQGECGVWGQSFARSRERTENTWVWWA